MERFEQFPWRAVAAAAAVSLGAAAVAVAAGWGPVRAVDDAVGRAVAAVAGDATWPGAVADVAGTVLVLAGVVVLLGWLAARRRVVAAAWAGVAVVGQALTEAALDAAVAAGDPSPAGAAAAFPSGHVATVTTVAVLTIALSWADAARDHDGPAARRARVAATALVVAVAFVALSRLAAGAHELSEVVGGGWTGMLWGALTARRVVAAAGPS